MVHAPVRCLFATSLWACLVTGCSLSSGGSGFGGSSAASQSGADAAPGTASDPSSGGGFASGSGGALGVDDAAVTAGDASPDGGSSSLTMTIRDFKMWNSADPTTNPDFENVFGDDRGIVEATLGSDGKPVYANATGTTATTHGKADFDQWYNDVDGVNIAVGFPITLTAASGGLYGYDSRVSGVPLSAANPTKEFFPIDDGTAYQTAFGNQGKPHNYSFTTELHTVFVYHGGETFSFSGDDDVFVFIAGTLVIDLGGVHNREQASVALDSLGLTVGQTYALDLFGAERHTTESNVSFETTLQLQPPPPR